MIATCIFMNDKDQPGHVWQSQRACRWRLPDDPISLGVPYTAEMVPEDIVVPRRHHHGVRKPLDRMAFPPRHHGRSQRLARRSTYSRRLHLAFDAAP